MKVRVTGSAGFIGSHVSMPLLDRGDQVIGFDHLNDYCNVNLKQARLARFMASSNAPRRLYNIGNERSAELMRYIEVLEQGLGKAEIDMLPLQPGDVPDTEADVSRLIEAVDCRPKVSVGDGVHRFVEWYLSCQLPRTYGAVSA